MAIYKLYATMTANFWYYEFYQVICQIRINYSYYEKEKF
jgi:hypothetical protein